MSQLIKHTPKLWERKHTDTYSSWQFYCQGCKCSHMYRTGAVDGPNWDFNGNLEKPTFTPSLMCNQNYPESRCHLFLTDGKIQFLNDCYHELRGQTVEMQDI